MPNSLDGTYCLTPCIAPCYECVNGVCVQQSICQRVIRRAICPLRAIPATPEGCYYGDELDLCGCPIYNLICNCGPVVELAAPPNGCHYKNDLDVHGCPVNYRLVCDATAFA